MELNILHLYPDSMNLYGEYANIAILRRHLEAMGVTVTVTNTTCEDIPDFSAADMCDSFSSANRPASIRIASSTSSAAFSSGTLPICLR